MSGNFTYVGIPGPGAVSKLFWFDLHTTFAVDNFVSNSSLGSVDIPLDLTVGFDQQIQNIGGSLFYDETSLYVFSGYTDDDLRTNDLAKYNTSSNQWTVSTFQGGEFSFGQRLNLLYASVPESGLSFVLGGNYGIVKGLLKANTSNPSQPTWSNTTTDSSGQIVPSNIAGAMIYVPMGISGVLLLIGGADSSHQGTQYSYGWPWDDVPMNKISVYDIQSDNWYTVNASGNVPAITVSNFCHSVSRSPDSSSFQVTIYGGWNLAEGQDTEDVYVLTVPSFRWIRMDTDNTEAVSEQTGRDRSTCATWNDAQMIVLGGSVRNRGRSVVNGSCNPEVSPIRVLDLSSYKWKSQFEPETKYTVHDNISSIIGGDSTGGANVKIPAGGWNNTDLEKIFSQTVPLTSTATQAIGPSTTTSSSKESDPSDNKGTSGTSIHGGAIAGIVIGTLAVILIIAFIGRYLWKRFKSKSKNKSKEQRDHSNSSPDPVSTGWSKAELATNQEHLLHAAPVGSATRSELVANEIAAPPIELLLEGQLSNASELPVAPVIVEADSKEQPRIYVK